MYARISEFSFFHLHPTCKRIENQIIAVKKKMKASLHLTFTPILKGGESSQRTARSGTKKENVNLLPSPCLHRKVLVFKTIYHMNIKRRPIA